MGEVTIRVVLRKIIMYERQIALKNDTNFIKFSPNGTPTNESYLDTRRGPHPGHGGEDVHHRRPGDRVWCERICSIWFYLLDLDNNVKSGTSH